MSKGHKHFSMHEENDCYKTLQTLHTHVQNFQKSPIHIELWIPHDGRNLPVARDSAIGENMVDVSVVSVTPLI